MLAVHLDNPTQSIRRLVDAIACAQRHALSLWLSVPHLCPPEAVCELTRILVQIEGDTGYTTGGRGAGHRRRHAHDRARVEGLGHQVVGAELQAFRGAQSPHIPLSPAMVLGRPHLVEHRDRLVELCIEVLLEQDEHLDDHGVAEGVVGLVTRLATHDDLLRPQDRQVLR